MSVCRAYRPPCAASVAPHTHSHTHTLTHAHTHTLIDPEQGPENAFSPTHTHTYTHRDTDTDKQIHTHREPCRPTFIQHLFMFSTREALNTLTNVRRMLDEPAPCYQCMCLIMAYGISFSTPVLQTFLYRCRSPRSYPAPVSWPNP